MSNRLSDNCFFSTSLSVIARICSQTAPLREWLVVRLCRTMRMGGIALKMGVLSERSEFRPFSNDGHSQRNGSFGRPPFAMPKRFARNQRFRLSAYLDSFFFGGSKKNEYMSVRETCPCILGYVKMNMDMYYNLFKTILSDISWTQKIVFRHTFIRNCLHWLSNRPVTGMTGCAASLHNENGWHCVKNGRFVWA